MLNDALDISNLVNSRTTLAPVTMPTPMFVGELHITWFVLNINILVEPLAALKPCTLLAPMELSVEKAKPHVLELDGVNNASMLNILIAKMELSAVKDLLDVLEFKDQIATILNFLNATLEKESVERDNSVLGVANRRKIPSCNIKNK